MLLTLSSVSINSYYQLFCNKDNAENRRRRYDAAVAAEAQPNAQPDAQPDAEPNAEPDAEEDAQPEAEIGEPAQPAQPAQPAPHVMVRRSQANRRTRFEVL